MDFSRTHYFIANFIVLLAKHFGNVCSKFAYSISGYTNNRAKRTNLFEFPNILIQSNRKLSKFAIKTYN